MSLQEKIIRLKMDALVAARHAAFWQKAIDIHGEVKATEFYTHLGLNHLEKKSFEFEGLMLSREPKEHEKLAVKGVHGAQEIAKESISTILLNLRNDLITDGLKRIKNLKPTTYHELTLHAAASFRDDLRERLMRVHRQGRMLVAAELAGVKKCFHEWSYTEPFQCHKCLVLPEGKEAVPEDELADLDELVGLTGSRVANDVQSRITAAAQRYSLLGLRDDTLITAVTTEIQTGSVAYIDRAATGLANRVISIGRSDEAQRRRDDWGRVEYSALLDQNVCGPCAAEDGDSANSEADLTPTPNPECEGGDWCRCFHVFVQD